MISNKKYWLSGICGTVIYVLATQVSYSADIIEIDDACSQKNNETPCKLFERNIRFFGAHDSQNLTPILSAITVVERTIEVSTDSADIDIQNTDALFVGETKRIGIDADSITGNININNSGEITISGGGGGGTKFGISAETGGNGAIFIRNTGNILYQRASFINNVGIIARSENGSIFIDNQADITGLSGRAPFGMVAVTTGTGDIVINNRGFVQANSFNTDRGFGSAISASALGSGNVSIDSIGTLDGGLTSRGLSASTTTGDIVLKIEGNIRSTGSREGNFLGTFVSPDGIFAQSQSGNIFLTRIGEGSTTVLRTGTGRAKIDYFGSDGLVDVFAGGGVEFNNFHSNFATIRFINLRAATGDIQFLNENLIGAARLATTDGGNIIFTNSATGIINNQTFNPFGFDFRQTNLSLSTTGEATVFNLENARILNLDSPRLGTPAVEIQRASQAKIVNDGTIEAINTAITIGRDVENAIITNNGIISTGLASIMADDAMGAITVHNNGTILGAIELGSGNDTVNAFSGSVFQSVDGSASSLRLNGGDDVLNIDAESTFNALAFGGLGTDTLNLTGASNAQSVLDAGNFSGFEQFILSGGMWRINGDQTFQSGRLSAGAIFIKDQLTFNGSSPFAVESGAVLAGSGQLTGNLDLFGTLSPGADEFSAFNIDGNLVFGAGSTLIFDIDALNSDLLEVTGNVRIDPGAQLSVRALNTQKFINNQTFQIIRLTGNGSFTGVDNFNVSIDGPRGFSGTTSLFSNNILGLTISNDAAILQNQDNGGFGTAETVAVLAGVGLGSYVIMRAAAKFLNSELPKAEFTFWHDYPEYGPAYALTKANPHSLNLAPTTQAFDTSTPYFGTHVRFSNKDSFGFYASSESLIGNTPYDAKLSDLRKEGWQPRKEQIFYATKGLALGLQVYAIASRQLSTDVSQQVSTNRVGIGNYRFNKNSKYQGILRGNYEIGNLFLTTLLNYSKSSNQSNLTSTRYIFSKNNQSSGAGFIFGKQFSLGEFGFARGYAGLQAQHFSRKINLPWFSVEESGNNTQLSLGVDWVLSPYFSSNFKLMDKTGEWINEYSSNLYSGHETVAETYFLVKF